MKISERIKKIRKMNGLKQAGFADRLGVSRGHVSRIERCGPISKALVKHICLEFQINETWLLNEEGEMVADKGAKILLYEETLVSLLVKEFARIEEKRIEDTICIVLKCMQTFCPEVFVSKTGSSSI